MWEYNNQVVDISSIRELARTDPWRTYWNSGDIVFNGPVCDWTDEQRLLVNFSKMYDNIYSNPDKPNSMIINDDDLLDGWLMDQQQNDEYNRKGGGDIKNQHPGANEVFVVAKSEEDIHQINQMNDMNAKVIKKQRQAVINKQGTASDLDFHDTKLDMEMQANQKKSQIAKRK